VKLKGLLSAIIFLSLLSSVYFVPRLIKINEVNCRTQFGSCSDEISRKVEGYLGQNYSLIRRGIRNELKDNSAIEKYSINIKLPHKLELFVIIKKPYFAVKSGDNSYFLVSESGEVLSTVTDTNLPFVELGNYNKEIGERVEDKILFALRIVKDMYTLYKVKNGVIENQDLKVEISQGPTAIFPLEGETKVLVGAFRMIYEQLNSGSENFRIEKAISQLTIDLRYKNPIIR